jgi:hypothetical protein
MLHIINNLYIHQYCMRRLSVILKLRKLRFHVLWETYILVQLRFHFIAQAEGQEASIRVKLPNPEEI